MSAAPVLFAAILFVTILLIWWWARGAPRADSDSPLTQAFSGVCAAVADLSRHGEDFLRRVGDDPGAPLAGYAASVRGIVVASGGFVRFKHGLADPEALYAGLASADDLFWGLAKSYEDATGTVGYDYESVETGAGERAALRAVAGALREVNRRVAWLGSVLAAE